MGNIYHRTLGGKKKGNLFLASPALISQQVRSRNVDGMIGCFTDDEVVLRVWCGLSNEMSISSVAFLSPADTSHNREPFEQIDATVGLALLSRTAFLPPRARAVVACEYDVARIEREIA